MAVRINLPDGNNYLAPDNTQEIPPLGSFEVYNNAVNTYNDMIGSFSMNSFEDMQAFLAEIMKVYGQGLVQQEGQIWNDGQRSGVLDELIPFEEDTSGGGTEGEAAEGTDAPSVPGNAVRGYMGYMGFNTALGLVTANKNSIENVAVSVAKGVKGFNAAKAQAELAEAVETMSTTSADDDLAAVVDAYNTARENEHTVPSRTDTAVSTAKNSLMGVNPFGLLCTFRGLPPPPPPGERA